jgi:hypothetical protein
MFGQFTKLTWSAFSYLLNHKKMKNCQQKAKQCHVFYNAKNILVIAVNTTPMGFNPYGHPVEMVSRHIVPEILGNLVINIMNASSISDENCIDIGNKLLYKHAGAHSWSALGKKWNMISIHRLLDTNKIVFTVFNADKNGYYLATTSDPTYSTDINPTEIGDLLLTIINKRCPCSKDQK